MWKKTGLIIVAGMIFILFFSGPSPAIGLRPLVFELDLVPGAVEDFEIILSPEETRTVVNLDLYQPVQLQGGELVFQKGNPKWYPATGWVELEKTRTVVVPGRKTVVSGRVRVPFDARGSHIVAVMVEPEAPQEPGVTLRFRFAVRLHIRVDRPGLRPAAEVKELAITGGEKGEPVIQALVQNTSPLDYLTTAEATVRDSQGRLVERVEMRPEMMWNYSQPEIRIYPFSELLYSGLPQKYLPPGEYRLQFFFRYAAGRQVVISETVQVKEGDFLFPEALMAAVQISPHSLEFIGRPGTVTSRGLTFENTSEQVLKIILEPVDIESGYPYSVFANTEFSIRGAGCFLIEPGRKINTIITVCFPRDAKTQGNYGLLKVKVVNPEGKLVEEQVIALAAVVTGEHRYTAEILDLTFNREEGEVFLAAVLKNTGNREFFPGARVLFQDMEGEPLNAIKLTPVGEEYVLPAKSITLRGTAGNLPPGGYQAEVEILAGEKVLKTTTMNVKLR